MDGYAVRAADVKNASEKHPAVLSVVEMIAAGYAPTKQVAAGQASRIMTGAMMPDGADAVIMQEVTQQEDDEVKIFESIDTAGNVRFTGRECLQKGSW